MDFACEHIDVQQVLKCSFSLTKAGCAVMRAVASSSEWVTSEELATQTGYDLATVQRSLKVLVEQGVLQRRQHNRDVGGYEYIYQFSQKDEFVSLVERTLDEWVAEAKKEVRHWTEQHT